MKRELIVGERIMYVDATTPLNGVFAVKIRGHISSDQLSNALKKIQQKHYLLRARIRQDKNSKPYFFLSDSINEIPVKIVDRNSDNDWKIQSEIEWKRLFDNEDQPLAHVVWLKGTEVSDLLLTCAHCICDGTSFVSLINELLLLLDHPETELTNYSGFDSVEQLVSQSFKSTTKQILKARIFSQLAKLFFFFKQTNNKKPVGESYLIHWRLGAKETGGVIARCKENNVTVHAALCVAFLQAFQKIKNGKAHGKVICPVDIRRFIKEINDDHLFAFAPIAELTIDKNSAADFWTKARILRDDLNRKIEAMKVYELLVMSEYFHSSVNKMVRFLKSTDGTHDITLSNMGRLNIREQYDSFEVETIYTPTIAFPWRNANTLVVSTFKGEMDFAICSNSGFLDKQDAEAIKNEAMLLLLQ